MRVRVGGDIAQGRSKVTAIASQALLYESFLLPFTTLSLIAYIWIVISCELLLIPVTQAKTIRVIISMFT